MKRLILVLTVVFLLPKVAFCDFSFRQLNQGLRDLDIKALCVSDNDPNLVYAGSDKVIYKTEDSGRSWRIAFSLRGTDTGVNFLSFNRKYSGIIYAATEDGLFKIKDPNSNIWEKLFSGISRLERKCTYILADGEDLFLGTEAGLFISHNGGGSWQKTRGELGRLFIRSIDKGENDLFVTTLGALFASSDFGKSWKKIFTSRLGEISRQESVDTASEDIPGEGTDNRIYVFVDRDAADKTLLSKEKARSTPVDKLNTVYLSSNKGIFVSYDNGGLFERVYSAGLASLDIRNIIINAGNVYVSSDKGVFVLNKDEQTWQSIYQGIISSDVRFITFDSLGRMWLASDKGILRSRNIDMRNDIGSGKFQNWGMYFKDEPTMAEIRGVAIEYAGVIDPRKIEGLRRGARLKALLPDLDLDYDRTISSYSGGKFYIGPQDWSLGLSWDLGDLIWSDQQRLIDSQVRLMVELRDEILTNITHLFFERRRLQKELVLYPPEDYDVEIEKQLRLEELTAQIDNLTGGYLSKQLGLE